MNNMRNARKHSCNAKQISSFSLSDKVNVNMITSGTAEGRTGSVAITYLTTNSQCVSLSGVGGGGMGEYWMMSLLPVWLTEWLITKGLGLGGEGEGDRIGMREGGAEDWSITVIDRLNDLRISIPGGRYITRVASCGHMKSNHTQMHKHIQYNHKHVNIKYQKYTHTSMARDVHASCHHSTTHLWGGGVSAGEKIHPDTGWIITACVQMDLLPWLGHTHTQLVIVTIY